MTSANIPMYYTEYRRLQESEHRLQEENRSLSRQLDIFVAAQSNFKKEQVEVTKIRKRTAERALHAEHLTKDLEECKSELKKGQEKWALEKKKLQTTLENVFIEFIEFGKVIQAQRSRIQELLENETFASQKIEELSEKIEFELVEKRLLNAEYKTASDNLVKYKSKVKWLNSKQNDLVDVHKCVDFRHKRDVDASKAEIHQMTMEINALKVKIETDALSYKALEGVVDQLNENEINLKMELENEKKETEKQHHLVIKLQTEERELTKHSVSKDEEILSLRSLNCKSEEKQRLLIIQTEGLTAERNLASQNLLKAQVELDDNKTTTENLQEDVRIFNREADEKNKVLAKAERDYCSVKRQLKNMEFELAETKNMFETFKKTQALMETFKLNEVTAAKAESEKVMLHRNATVALLEEKKAEIECLTSILVQLPEDAISKFHQWQWDMRDLRKQLMAEHGNSMMYESMYTSVEKQNKELTDDLRKLKLQLGCKNALALLSKNPQSPTEDKSKDECKPVLRHIRFPLIKSERSEEYLPVTSLPPIHVQCRGVKLKPRPTPPPSPSPRSQMGHSQRPARRLSVVLGSHE